MTTKKRRKLITVAAIDIALLAYFIIWESMEPLECECERLHFQDWLMVAPLFLLICGVIIYLAYTIIAGIISFFKKIKLF